MRQIQRTAFLVGPKRRLSLVQRITWMVSSVVLFTLLLPGPVATAGFPGRNGAIAFSRFTNRQTDIWVLHPGSSTPKRLTNSAKRNEGMPDWNGTGTRLAFSRCARGGPLSNCDIWTMNPDGSDQRRITFTPEAQETWPTWSPDGTRIAYTSNAEDDFQDVWVMDADGGNQTRLTTTVGFDAFPEWSPDGTKIAFTSDRAALDDIWVMDADGGNPTRLTRGPKIDERPDWSPDGARIAFSRNGDIFVMDADGGNLTRLTATKGQEFAPAFSPNGRRIAYNAEVEGRIGVWSMRVNGTGRRQLTTGKFDFFPDWQPTGLRDPRPQRTP
jgi:Tol biopolymer transport system component